MYPHFLDFLAVTLIELDNLDSPNIGTIHSDIGDEEELKEKMIEALETHFDAKVEKVEFDDSLEIKNVRNSPPIDATVFLSTDLSEESYRIQIQQTFIY